MNKIDSLITTFIDTYLHQQLDVFHLNVGNFGYNYIAS